jgi:lipopolysaccharide transport system ATP-binding protein
MSNNKVAIKAEDVSKLYRIGLKEKVHDTIGGAVLDFIKSPLHNFKKYRSLYNFKDHRRSTDGSKPENVIKALDDVSFNIRKGESVGIIGSNGAGKSTLLKILSRVTSPTEGVVGIRGKIGCLLEVGTGFHMELTGRENIYLNGAILGMRKEEIDRKIDDIIEFSGVEKFIDTPVKRYSSGMKVRVGFAVAAHLDPEILIIDEVLAVGDIRFQEKCLGKMKTVAGEGRTVLFVSHNLSAVQALCTRGILLRNGRIVIDAPVDETIDFYLESISDASSDPFKDNPNRSGSAVVRYTNARILGPDGKEKTQLTAGEPVTFEFSYLNRKQISKAFASMTIYNDMGTAVANFDMEIRGFQIDKLEEKGTVLCHLESLPLPIGRYRVAVAMIHKGIGMADHLPNALTFTVVNSQFFETGRTPQMKYSACMVHHNWEHFKQDETALESGHAEKGVAVPELARQQN